MGDLKGQIAVVTGAAQGLGLAIVEKLARQSATVIILDIQCDKAKAASEELVRDGMSVEAADLDITDSNAVTNLFNRIEHSHGHLDILVNNAGVGQVISPIVELSDEEWNRVLRVTLSGTF